MAQPEVGPLPRISYDVSKQRKESLSKDVFERRTSTGSEVFSLTICLDAKKFGLISFFSLIRTIYLRVSTKPPPNDAKRPLPVDVRRSKTLLLKLPKYRIIIRFWENCPPIPTLSQHFALSEKQVLMLV